MVSSSIVIWLSFCALHVSATTTSTVLCAGHLPSKKACVFHNVSYERDSNTIIFYEQEETIKAVGLSNSSSQFWFDAGDNDYLVGKSFLTFPGLSKPYNIRISRPLSTQRLRGNIYDGMTMMWLSTPNSDFSFGHCVVDDWYPMFMVQSALFLDFIPHHIRTVYHGSVPRLCSRMMNDMNRGHSIDVESLPDLSFFESVVVGALGFTEQRHSRVSYSQLSDRDFGSSAYTSQGWWQFRSHVHRAVNTGRQTSVGKRPRAMHPTILVNNRTDTVRPHAPRRSIVNLQQTLACLRQKLQADVRLVDFTRMSLRDQAQELLQADVLITTQGSASFGIPLMKAGSTAIIVGSPHYKERCPYHPFIDYIKFFPLSYVNILKYHIAESSTEEYIPDPVDVDNCLDVSVRINCVKLVDLINSALLKTVSL
jgi:hypothetical protein